MSQFFSVAWSKYTDNITKEFQCFRSDQKLVDVTLCCEGRQISAHKILLSACSTYFKEILLGNPNQHPVIIFNNVKYEDLNAIIEYMYKGEVNVQQEYLSSFLITAEMLAVHGSTDKSNLNITNLKEDKTAKSALPSFKYSKQQSYSVTTQTNRFFTETQTSEYRTPNFVSTNRTYSDITDLTNKKKRRMSHERDCDQYVESVEDCDHQYLSHEQVEDCDHQGEINGESDGNLQQANNVIYDETSPNVLKGGLQYYYNLTATHIADEVVCSDSYDVNESNNLSTELPCSTQESHENGQLVLPCETLEEHQYYMKHEPQPSQQLTINQPTKEGIYPDSKPNESNYSSKCSRDAPFKIQESGDRRQHVLPCGASGAGKYRTLCNFCNVIFSSVAALKRHNESKHTKADRRLRATCPECERTFKTKCSLSTHKTQFHRKKNMEKDEIDLDLHDLKA